MSFLAHCPSCNSAWTIADEHDGRVFGCTCGAKFNARRPPPTPPRSVPTPAARRARRPRRGHLKASLCKAAVVVAWTLCLCWTGYVFLSTVAAISRTQSAIQEASASAYGCFCVVAGYVVARCVQELARRV